MEIAASQTGLSIFHLVSQASFLVQLVMMVLLLASVVSWYMIFNKWFSLRSAHAEADEFEDSFWAGGDMTALFKRNVKGGREPTGMSSVFAAGYREFTRISQNPTIDRGDVLDGVQRAMRVALSREIEDLETHLSFLATVGSTSPYVGLFGTVWGIMNSFRALGAMQQATIASVAPGIAEALIATAMGLFAAIPAVIAYNRYSNDAERLVTRYETFMEEFLSIVNRQADTGKS